MSQLTTNTTTIDELITLANNLPDAGSGGEDVSAETAEYTGLLDDLETAIDALPEAGGGGGGTVETSAVTIKQQWGGNDDPDKLYVFITAYNIESGTVTPYYAKFDSYDDLLSEHSVTLSMYKNVPFTVVTYTGNGADPELWVTTTTNGGQLEQAVTLPLGPVMYQLTPTDDTATFTFASP